MTPPGPHPTRDERPSGSGPPPTDAGTRDAQYDIGAGAATTNLASQESTKKLETAKHANDDGQAESLGINFCAAAFTTYGGWGAEFRYRYVEPHFRSALCAQTRQSQWWQWLVCHMSSPKSSAFCATLLPFYVVKIPVCSEAPHVRAPLGAGLSMRLGAPRLREPLPVSSPLL
jgi:hypothetical protein